MAIELPRELVVEFEGCDGGLHLMPARPGPPESMLFQGGLFHVEMFNFDGRIIAPPSHAGRAIRVFVTPLDQGRFKKGRLNYIGSVSDRSDQDLGLGAQIHIPTDDWLPTITCLGSIWRRLTLLLVEGAEGKIAEFSFAGAPPR
ncbi:hypothetical protein [Phenylobacterium sp.]|jgi:hypothetical protein|uniref:hypothetical protein n=1 Tax=Phenylobacterium sp. TaxID=1871053 RepID=UPI002F41422A